MCVSASNVFAIMGALISTVRLPYYGHNTHSPFGVLKRGQS